MLDERNPRRVRRTTWRCDLAALRAFYDWAARTYGVRNPTPRRERESHRRIGRPSTPRRLASHAVIALGASIETSIETSIGKARTSADRRVRPVRWLTPHAFRRWVDLGLHGVGLDGRDAPVWLGRNSQRDAAFADLLYGTGLRLQEAGSLLVAELPPLDRERPYYTCVLAARCATDARGRNYYMSPRVLDDLDYYIGPEGERCVAISQAQEAHRYESLPNLRLLVQARDRTLQLHAPGDSAAYDIPLDALGPRERRTLCKETPSGLEPLALWVNEMVSHATTTGGRAPLRPRIAAFAGSASPTSM